MAWNLLDIDNAKSLGLLLRQKRDDVDGSPDAFEQADVALALDISQSYVSKIERGLSDKRIPKWPSQQQRKLLEAYKFTREEMVKIAGKFALDILRPTLLEYDPSGDDVMSRFLMPETEWTHYHVMHSASAGTGEPQILDEDEIVSIPTQKLRARGANKNDVMVVKVNGDCLVSQILRTSRRNVAHGDYVFIHMGAPAQPNDIVCVWDEQDSQLMLKFASEQSDPDNPDEIMFYDAKGRSYIRNVNDVKYRGVAFWKSGEL